MTFGIRAASNIAQRFANILMHIFSVEMEKSDVEALPALRSAHPALDEWLRLRESLEPKVALLQAIHAEYVAGARVGSFKVFARRRLGEAGWSNDDIRNWLAQEYVDTPHLFVAKQARLWQSFMFTDDILLLFVGVETTIRGLLVWDDVTMRADVLMSPQKRQLGVHAVWIGAGFIFSLAVAYVPRRKVLKALDGIERTLGRCNTNSGFQGLLGLLEHIVFIASMKRNVMWGGWDPVKDASFRQHPDAAFQPKEMSQHYIYYYSEISQN